MHPDNDTLNAARAFTVILAGPNHLIGDRSQVEACTRPSRRAKPVAELPPWYAEWQDFLPTGTSRSWKHPHQVTAFFRCGTARSAHATRGHDHELEVVAGAGLRVRRGGQRHGVGLPA